MQGAQKLRSELPLPILGVRPDAPTIETIVPVTFYEIIKVLPPSNFSDHFTF
jgi:hypothetical protein